MSSISSSARMQTGFSADQSMDSSERHQSTQKQRASASVRWFGTVGDGQTNVCTMDRHEREGTEDDGRVTRERRRGRRQHGSIFSVLLLLCRGITSMTHSSLLLFALCSWFVVRFSNEWRTGVEELPGKGQELNLFVSAVCVEASVAYLMDSCTVVLPSISNIFFITRSRTTKLVRRSVPPTANGAVLTSVEEVEDEGDASDGMLDLLSDVVPMWSNATETKRR